MKRALAIAALAACTGETGTVSVSLTTAPGSDLVSRIQRLDMTLTNPYQKVTATRTSSGLDLSLELPATSEVGALQIDGFDGTGALIAVGASPKFPVGGIDGHITIYLGEQNTIGAAPASLMPPRFALATSPLSYGAVLAGGTLDGGAPSDAVGIYNAFDHSLATALPLPAPRAGLALATGANNFVYLFGGRDAAGSPTATAWRYDTNIAPSGAIVDYGDKTGFARTDQVLVPIGNERFLASGAPPTELSGLDGSMTAKTGIAEVGSGGASLLGSDGVATAVFAGPSGVVRFRNGMFTPIDLPAFARAGVQVVAIGGGKVVLVCGGPGLAVLDVATLDVTMPVVDADPVLNFTGCAVAATTRHFMIAGGTGPNGGTVPSAFVYELPDLTPLVSIPLVVARTGASALALPNDQLLLVGGTDANGAPVATIELFTPANVPVR